MFECVSVFNACPKAPSLACDLMSVILFPRVFQRVLVLFFLFCFCLFLFYKGRTRGRPPLISLLYLLLFIFILLLKFFYETKYSQTQLSLLPVSPHLTKNNNDNNLLSTLNAFFTIVLRILPWMHLLHIGNQWQIVEIHSIQQGAWKEILVKESKDKTYNNYKWYFPLMSVANSTFIVLYYMVLQSSNTGWPMLYLKRSSSP